MKRLLFLILLLPLAWCACTSKSLVDPPPVVEKGTITATIGGIDETFNISDSVFYFPRQPQTSDWIFKASGKEANGDRIWFIIDYQAPILPGGTYNNDDTSKPINVTMSYIMPGKQYICSTPSPVSVTLTTFTSTNVQGTFSGSPANNGEVKSVINGKFNLDFSKPVTITQ